ncbi:isoleucine--tRNA ligase [candidate division WOR-3 bacterium]|uniref:Isoleucine--tRNA ligase n=1 Tax=candidate division WOR-3 bacterium TaxID=2052148 RepID=A0A9D5QCM9_UNCW3|nr:isoleucine--tRNA ligase [candidate division WOR-3 bacterium]MBD3364724.1 isoleucine--tRNA ligase [candidate division WOR-3 bacterium]
MNYKDTILLPRTDFPMRARLSEREPGLLDFWVKNRIYEKMIEARRKGTAYILHDGPPYSNGHVHIGTALNKVVKDFVIKYKSMDGFFAPYVPGWDNHGLPIENNVLAEFRKNKKEITRQAIRKRCREYAAKFVDIQKQEFVRLGVLGEWDNPYLTMSLKYESEILRIFAKLVKKGYVYRDLRSIYWCPTCETALADAEIEYHEKTSHSIWMRFPLADDPDGIFPRKENSYAMVWTTTPWTIPANLAVTVKPDFEYFVIKRGDDRYLVAKALLDLVVKSLEWDEKDLKIESRVEGKKLEGLKFKHPLYDRPSPVLLGDFVNPDQGTGIVHTAPGHGEDDFLIGKRYGLDILCPVDEKGYFTEEAGKRLAGMHINKGNQEVLAMLEEVGALLKHSSLEHQYPHCWRCHNPVIYRATPQWFMDIDHKGHRQKALMALDKVKWIPEESYERIKAAIENRPDWCLSRQRYWGVGIPAFYCDDCGEVILTTEIAAKTADLVSQHSADLWFADDILGYFDGIKCPKCSGVNLRPETDILDVWFDSSCSSLIVCRNWEGLRWPVELFLEGPDQHRGWFNVSLMTSLGTEETIPYGTVITHGWVVDQEGKAMHKSLGNYVTTDEIVNKYGADVLRLWVAAAEYTRDVRVSAEILARVIDAYRKIRNTLRFLLGNLADFTEDDAVPLEELPPRERYVLHELNKLVGTVREGLTDFAFHRSYQSIYTFCVVVLSSFYMDVIKDTLYTREKDSHIRRSVQTVLARVLDVLTRLLAPFISFTAEEAYGANPVGENKESVFLEDFPHVDSKYEDRDLAFEFSKLFEVRDKVLKVLEVERREGRLRASIDARVVLSARESCVRELLKKYEGNLAEFFIVSGVDLVDRVEAGESGEGSEYSIEIEEPRGRKCVRCWLWSESVGSHADHPEICDKCYEAITKQS